MIEPESVPLARPKRKMAWFQRCRTITVMVLSIVGLLSLSVAPAQAQVQIEQVESVASEIKGGTQGRFAIDLSGDECKPDEASCGDVSRSQVLRLIPKGTPSLQDRGSGNSSVIVQRGSSHHATVEQVGSDNEASITQMNGTGNEALVQQTGGSSGGAAQFGSRNLAVIVQNGSMNETTIRQWGTENIAGIRLDGDNNGVTLRQEGDGNEYLLDFDGNLLGTSTSTSSHEVVQVGANNQLIQTGEGLMPFNVRQRGEGMRMIIRHNK